MSEGIAIHPKVNLDAAVLTFNWVSSPGADAPPGGIDSLMAILNLLIHCLYEMP
jgi:hypothetical protein